MLANHHAPASNDSPQGDSDYDIILTALMATARGRSFLQEYAQRHRAADTATLLTAIGRIEGLLTSRSLEPAAPASDATGRPAEATQAPDMESSGIGAMAAEIDELMIHIDLMDEVTEIDAVAIEMAEIETPPAGSAESAPHDDAALQVTAIEFLGPELTGAKPVQREAAPPAGRIWRKTLDPFADIRALSDEEKIALFA
jgi:hypothetical protein